MGLAGAAGAELTRVKRTIQTFRRGTVTVNGEVREVDVVAERGSQYCIRSPPGQSFKLVGGQGRHISGRQTAWIPRAAVKLLT